MYKYFKICLLTIASSVLATGACKLDNTALPKTATNSDIETVMGITVTGGEISDGYLTAEWKTIRTVKQYYDKSYTVISGAIVPGKFSSISLDDSKKSFQYRGLVNTTATASGTYRLFTTYNVLFLQLPNNPFFNTPTSTLRITDLTPNTMTWVAMDTTLVNINGKPSREAYQIVFAK